MKIHTLIGTLLASATLLAGCGSSTDAGPSIVGTYTLTQAAGASLPFIESQAGGVTIRLTSETLTAGANGSYTTNGTQQTTNGSGTTESQFSTSGTYAKSGSGYSFTDNLNGTGSGTLSGNTLTVTLSGIVFVFTRN